MDAAKKLFKWIKDHINREVTQMLRSIPSLTLRLVFAGMLVTLLLGVGGGPKASFSAPEDPFSEHAEPYQFTLSVPTVSSSETASAPASSDLSGWRLLNEQDFSSNSLGAWQTVNRADPDSDETWGPAVISSGNWGAWVRGGAVQADLSSSTVYTYTSNMDTWLVYGPIDNGKGIWNLKLAFDYFISLGNGDAFIVGYSTDGTNFDGLRVTSLKMDPQIWAGAEIDWQVNKEATQYWVAFGFTSNDDDDVDQGVWLDHLILQANYGGETYLALVANQWVTEPEDPEIIGFFDDFSDPATGWRDRLYEHFDDVDVMRVGYVNETYRMKILLNYDGRNNRLMGIAKAPYTDTHTNYDLQVRHSFFEANDDVTPEFGKGGLIFGADNTFSTTYVFEWNYEGNCAVNKYTDADYPVTRYEDEESDFETHTIMDWRNCSEFKIDGGYDADNHILVEVRDAKATIYVMDGETKVKVKEFTDTTLRNNRRVGLVTGSWEYTPVDSRFDDFWIKPVE